jgi:hypothetical protein
MNSLNWSQLRRSSPQIFYRRTPFDVIDDGDNRNRADSQFSQSASVDYGTDKKFELKSEHLDSPEIPKK